MAQPRRRLLPTGLRKQLDERGTLDVLRHGIECSGCASRATGAVQARAGDEPGLAGQVRGQPLRVLRQAMTTHNDIIDLVLYLQRHSGGDSRTQDRLHAIGAGCGRSVPLRPQPPPQGQPAAEPLLDFPRGALVHFAVTTAK